MKCIRCGCPVLVGDSYQQILFTKIVDGVVELHTQTEHRVCLDCSAHGVTVSGGDAKGCSCKN